MISLVDLTAFGIPIVAYYAAYSLYSVDITILSIFGATGLSVSAFVFWLRSQYLANLYLTERQARSQQRLRNGVASLSAEEDGKGASPDSHGQEKTDGVRTPVGPRTVPRIAPVLPAFMSLVCLLAVAGHLLVAASLTVYEIVTML